MWFVDLQNCGMLVRFVSKQTTEPQDEVILLLRIYMLYRSAHPCCNELFKCARVYVRFQVGMATGPTLDRSPVPHLRMQKNKQKKKDLCCVTLSDTTLSTEPVSNCVLPSCTMHYCSLTTRERPVAIAKLSACTQEAELTDSQLAYVSETSRDACLQVERSEEEVGSCIASGVKSQLTAKYRGTVNAETKSFHLFSSSWKHQCISHLKKNHSL